MINSEVAITKQKYKYLAFLLHLTSQHLLQLSSRHTAMLIYALPRWSSCGDKNESHWERSMQRNIWNKLREGNPENLSFSCRLLHIFFIGNYYIHYSDKIVLNICRKRAPWSRFLHLPVVTLMHFIMHLCEINWTTQ